MIILIFFNLLDFNKYLIELSINTTIKYFTRRYLIYNISINSLIVID